MNRPWTEAELKILLSAKNKKYAKVPNRSKKSIRRKLVALGLIKPAFKIKFHNKKSWSQKEIDLLKSAKDPRKVKISNRSRQSIVCMAIRLGIVKKQTAKRPWTKKDEKLLIRLVKEGKTPQQIFKMNVFSKPHSRNSIQKKTCYLGLAKKSIKKASKFSEFMLLNFKKFLKENWEGKTPSELMQLWNKQNVYQVTKNRVVYHLTSMGIKIPYSEVLIIQNLRAKEENIKNSGGSVKSVEENLRIARAKVMRDRVLKNRNIWTGLPLDEQDLLLV